MKTVTIPEEEYLKMRQTVAELKKQVELLCDNSFIEKLSTAYLLFCKNKETDGTERISLKRGSGKGIITYIAEDFDESLEDFKEYME